ncbi:hypothetical protein BLTE_10780 [Blastochloris tepida]|uniref:Uncharacterized protein n=1 Tax=Blastochloris tepida TaxID=2233851 RepID=A0A348FYL0_9HYPH|nr:hypothetical protein BLTE_10780 [Blastochloris tepida]
MPPRTVDPIRADEFEPRRLAAGLPRLPARPHQGRLRVTTARLWARIIAEAACAVGLIALLSWSAVVAAALLGRI